MNRDFWNKSIKEQRNSILIREIFILIIAIITLIIYAYTFISFFIHWFSNDGLTFMQNFKWWFNEYIFLLIICIVARIICRKMHEDVKSDKIINLEQYKRNHRD